MSITNKKQILDTESHDESGILGNFYMWNMQFYLIRNILLIMLFLIIGKLADLDWATKLNRFVLTILGVWPEIGAPRKFGMRDIRVLLVLSVMVIGLIIPQINALSLVINEYSLVIENIVTITAVTTCALKLLFMWLHQESNFFLHIPVFIFV